MSMPSELSPCDIAVSDAIAALPVTLEAMPAMPDIPVMAADVTVAIILWSMIVI